MARQKKILLDNALVSWANAIRYCDQILAGKITLEVRKNFVSSLHNAVELFLKQIMLDNCDYRVAEPRRIDADGEPAKAFYAATNLNAYFETLDSDTRNKFTSIEFSSFYDLHKKLLASFLQSRTPFTNELQKLNKLRNNETHFYIGLDEYLTESEFCMLHNFMVTFYQVLHNYRLLPFWGEARSEHKKLCFDRSPLTAFSYVDAVKKSPMVNAIEQAANGMEFEGYAPSTVYEIASAIASEMDVIADIQFDELWVYVEVLDRLGMIEVVQTGEDEYDNPEYEHDYCAPPTITFYRFAIKITI
jgi:hypothetical protein